MARMHTNIQHMYKENFEIRSLNTISALFNDAFIKT
jgi:hypothetical protein